MNNEDIVAARLREIMQIGQAQAAQLGKLLGQQHYTFAHKLVPYIIKEHFHELITAIADNSAQQWICQIWKEAGGAELADYSEAIYPECHFVKASDELGLIYFVMPAPRTTTEALYTAIVFLMDEDLPSMWLWRYFTLELGGAHVSNENSSTRWVFAEWDNSEHTNHGSFESKPTLNNFLAYAVAKAQDDWY